MNLLILRVGVVTVTKHCTTEGQVLPWLSQQMNAAPPVFLGHRFEVNCETGETIMTKGNAGGGEGGAKDQAKTESKPVVEVNRWSPRRKMEVVLRLLRGEPMDAVSREMGVELYRLEAWKQRAVAGLEASLKERGSDPQVAELAEAMRRIGELTMDNELLQHRARRAEGRAGSPFVKRRSQR